MAIAIAGTALAALVQAIGTNLRHAALSGEYTQATALAESMLSRVGAELPLRTGEHRGRFDARFQWRRVIRKYHAEDLAPDSDTAAPLTPYEIAVTVWWDTDNGVRQLTLRTLRLKLNGRSAS